jgi:RNA binding exosome subunit
MHLRFFTMNTLIYNKIGVPVQGIHCKETEMHEKVVDLIDHFRPDIFHASPFLYNEYLEQERQFYYINLSTCANIKGLLRKCLDLYNKIGVPVQGIHCKETEMHEKVVDLIATTFSCISVSLQ